MNKPTRTLQPNPNISSRFLRKDIARVGLRDSGSRPRRPLRLYAGYPIDDHDL